MPIIITPEVGLPIPDINSSPEEKHEFRERAHLLCRTILATHGGQDNIEITQQDERDAAHMFATSTIPVRPVPRPGSILKLEALLTEYDHKVVASAAQLRTYVTNKLIEESNNRNDKIRIKALELLGKIGDVGLFAEKVEVTIKDKRTEELEGLLREKLERFMGKAQVVELPPVPPKPMNEIDVNAHFEGDYDDMEGV